jgi:hypothetical protein
VQEQQVIYKSEVERIWKSQHASLSRKDEPVLSDHDEDNAPVTARRLKREQSAVIAETSNISLSAMTPPIRDMASPAFSRASSADRDLSVGPEGQSSKVLRIRRLVRIRKHRLLSF